MDHSGKEHLLGKVPHPGSTSTAIQILLEIKSVIFELNMNDSAYSSLATDGLAYVKQSDKSASFSKLSSYFKLTNGDKESS